MVLLVLVFPIRWEYRADNHCYSFLEWVFETETTQLYGVGHDFSI